jgi:hypothetical protein
VRPREETTAVGGIGVHWARWLEALASRMDHAPTMHSIELMGTKVMWEGFLDSYDKIARPLGRHPTRL